MASPDPIAAERAHYLALLGRTVDDPAVTLAELRSMTGAGVDVRSAAEAKITEQRMVAGSAFVRSVNGINPDINGNVTVAGGGGSSDWSSISNKPATFPPDAHSHPISGVTSLQSILDGKSATGHGHAIADVTGLQGTLDGKSATGHTHGAADLTGVVKTVNGTAPDGAGNVTVSGGGGGGASVAWSGVNVGDHLPVWANGGHGGFTMITTRIIPCPLVAVEAMNVDAVSIYVETGVATSTVDLALYTYNMTTGKPGSFVQHLATIDTSTSGLKTATFTPIALAAGIHVVIGRANTANVTLWGVAGSIGVYRMTSPSGGSNQYTLPHATWTGTVPSWPSSPTWDWNAGVYSPTATLPKLQLRRSA